MESVARERKVGAGFVVVAFSAGLGLISTAIAILGGGLRLNPEDFPDIPPQVLENIATATQIGTPIITALVPFVWWLLVTLVMQLVTRFFGGSGPISAMFAVVGVAFIPLVANAALAIPIAAAQTALGPQSAAASVLGLLSFALFLLFAIWHVALIIVGASFSRSVSYGESGGSCAISCAGCLGLVVLAFLGLALVGVALGGG